MDRRTVLMGIGASVAAVTATAASSAAAQVDTLSSTAPSQEAPVKIAVISGVSSGIGNATALALADRGVNVIGTFRKNEAGAMQLVEEAEKRGVKIVPFYLDLNSMESITKLRDNALTTLRQEWQTDKIDYLVNNAGMSIMANFPETSEEAFDEMSRVLLKGHFFMTQAFLPSLKDGGAIVNVTSSSTLPTSISPGFSAYAAMKGGLTTLTRYMAKEFAPRKIRVNSVAPGPTRTRLGNDGFARFPEVIPGIAAETALQRLGEPSDLGQAIATLLSDELGWVTGENIEVSGGYRM